MTPAEPPKSSRRAVVILGMHRSGTSAVAGALQGWGVELGPRLMPATEANQRGYCEHIDIVNLHDRLLLALGRTWDDVSPFDEALLYKEPAAPYRAELLALLERDFGRAALWGVKDPRLCLLLPWWAPVWTATETAPIFVIVLRNPEEIAASLVRREGFSTAKAHLLTLQHLLAAERTTRGQERVFIDFPDFLADWPAALRPVAVALGLPETRSADSAFVDPGLRRSVPDASAPAPGALHRLGAALRREAAEPGSGREECDRLAELLQASAALYEPLRRNAGGDGEKAYLALGRQTRWYEEEWQKARQREQKALERCSTLENRLAKVKNRILIKEEHNANVRIANVSSVRKTGIWGRLKIVGTRLFGRGTDN